MRAVLLQPEATVGEVIDVDGSLEALQGLVGGYIEHVQVARTPRSGLGMYVHDEGMIRDLPVNGLATTLYWNTRRGGVPAVLPYAIHGPAVVVAGPDDEGDDLPMDEESVGMLILLGIPIAGEPR
jgi:Domain of unknown function (DUF3846)